MIYIIDLHALKELQHFCIEKRTELINREDENIFISVNLSEKANFNYTVLHQYVIFIFEREYIYIQKIISGVKEIWPSLVLPYIT